MREAKLQLPIVLITLVLAAFLISACQNVNEPVPTQDQARLPTAVPTATLKPSPTPTNTPTVPPKKTKPSASPTAMVQPTPTAPPTTTLLFTGVIVPARCVQAKIDELGDPHYPYEEVREIISSADLAIGTLNATISDYPPHTGCVRTYVLVGSAENADALAESGFDAMSVATNHIKNCGPANCGDRAFFDTLYNLERVGIEAVGAGADHEEAMQPLVIEVNGVRFGIVSQGQIEQRAFAGEDSPGIAILNSENIITAVEAARLVSDVVIFMPHWGPEDVPVPNWIQRNLAKEIVDAGADIVVGNHTHVVQAIQEINGVPVFYGLGNFVFDQDLQDHQQGVILIITFDGNELAGFELIPTHVDEDGRVHIAGEEEASQILERIEQASQAIR